MNLGKRIIELRKSKGWSQEKLEEITEIKREYISKLENNHHDNPTQSTILKIARAIWSDKRITDEVVMANFYGGGSVHRQVADLKSQCAALLATLAVIVLAGEQKIAEFASREELGQ